MYLPDRLRQCREAKNLSQGDIEKRIGLLRCYVSRVENGHTTPALETLEKMARALEVSLYQLFYEGDTAPSREIEKDSGLKDWASWGNGARKFRRLRHDLSRMEESDRKLMFELSKMMVGKRSKRSVR